MKVEHETVVTADARRLVDNPKGQNDILDENPMAVPHNLFSLQAQNSGDALGTGRMITTAKIVTPYICKLISYEVAIAPVHEQIKIFRTLSMQPTLRSVVDTLFGRFVLCWLASGLGSLHSTPARSSNGLEIPACTKEGQTVLFKRKTALKNMEVKHFPLCFLPGSQTFPTIDAIILTTKCLITVQVTMSNEHSANTIGFDEIRESGIRNRTATARTKPRCWCHVFVTDEESKAKSLREQTFSNLPEDIYIYSAVFDIGQSDINIEKMRLFDVSGLLATYNLCSFGDQTLAPKDTMDVDGENTKLR
jgi:hypothetical protein